MSGAADKPGLRGDRGSTFARGRAAERRVAWHYRLRGYRILARNVRAGGVELDLIVRRGRRLGERLRRGAQAWLHTNPDLSALQVCFDFAAARPAGIEVVADPLH